MTNIAYSSLEQFVLSQDEENVDLVREGLFAESWLFKYSLRPENSDLKNLVEKVNKVYIHLNSFSAKSVKQIHATFSGVIVSAVVKLENYQSTYSNPKCHCSFQQKKTR